MTGSFDVVADVAIDVIATIVDDVDDTPTGEVNDHGGAQVHGAVNGNDHVDVKVEVNAASRQPVKSPVARYQSRPERRALFSASRLAP